MFIRENASVNLIRSIYLQKKHCEVVCVYRNGLMSYQKWMIWKKKCNQINILKIIAYILLNFYLIHRCQQHLLSWNWFIFFLLFFVRILACLLCFTHVFHLKVFYTLCGVLKAVEAFTRFYNNDLIEAHV